MRFVAINQMRRRAEQGFTLVEAMITSGTLVIVIGSVVYCCVFGLASAARQQIWVGASNSGSQAMGKLMSDIRSANTIEVGSLTNGTFSQVSASGTQAGNALLIYPTTNTLPWTVYYYNAVSNSLVRSNYNGGGVSGNNTVVVANPVTNDATHSIFTEVDSTDTALTTATPTAAVDVYLSFIASQNKQILINTGGGADFYQMHLIISPRLRL